MIRNEERIQTKLDRKFRGPFVVTELLDNDRYKLKSLSNNRSFKYSHDKLRKMPENHIPNELDVCSDNESCAEKTVDAGPEIGTIVEKETTNDAAH